MRKNKICNKTEKREIYAVDIKNRLAETGFYIPYTNPHLLNSVIGKKYGFFIVIVLVTPYVCKFLIRWNYYS